MGCASCATNGNGTPRGCKSNGTCGTDSCNKLTVFDRWTIWNCPPVKPLFVGRGSFQKQPKRILAYRWPNCIGGWPCNHWGGQWLWFRLGNFDWRISSFSDEKENILRTGGGFKLLRKANQQEIDKWHSLRDKEPEIQKRARELALAWDWKWNFLMWNFKEMVKRLRFITIIAE